MTINRRGGLLAAVCLAVLAAAAGPAPAETLAEAIASAYESNPSLQAQRAGQRALDENWVQARVGYRPTLSASVQPFWQETQAGKAGGGAISRLNTGSASFSFTQPIFTGGRTAAAVSQAEADILAGRENLRRAEAQVIGQVIQTYVDVRRDQAALEIRREDLKVLQRQLEESKARFEVGEITRTDVAQSEARLAASRALVQQATGQLAISRSVYLQTVGRNPGDLAPPPTLDDLIPGTIDQAFDVAERDNAQIRAAQYTERSSRAQVDGVRALRMPRVSLQGSVGYSGTVEPFHAEKYARNNTASAVITMPLFSGGAVSSEIRQALERNNVSRIGVETTRRGVIQLLTQSWSSLIAARENITSNEEQVRAAMIAAEGVHQEQQVGLRTTLDVLNAEQELRFAQISLNSAVHDAYVASAGVLSQLGRLQADYLIPNTPRYDPRANFGKLRITWGWTPWEEVIAPIDSLLTSKVKERPLDKPQAALK